MSGSKKKTQAIRDRVAAVNSSNVDAYAQHYREFGSVAAEHMLEVLTSNKLAMAQEVLRIEEDADFAASG